MHEEILEKMMDTPDVKLTPGEPTVCLGNGEQGFECACDECNYYLLCFPEFDPFKPNAIAAKPLYTNTLEIE